jgi:hypothetical protein
MDKSTNNNEYDCKLYKQQYNNNKWGFTQFSEKINGRFAMIGFLLFYSIELITKENLLNLIMKIYFN